MERLMYRIDYRFGCILCRIGFYSLGMDLRLEAIRREGERLIKEMKQCAEEARKI